MARLVTEWVNVTGNISIIARGSGDVWFHAPGDTEENDPFAIPMTGMGSAGSTIGLLDGAINLGFAGIEKRLARPDPTIAGYTKISAGKRTPLSYCVREMYRARKKVSWFQATKSPHSGSESQLLLNELRQ